MEKKSALTLPNEFERPRNDQAIADRRDLPVSLTSEFRQDMQGYAKEVLWPASYSIGPMTCYNFSVQDPISPGVPLPSRARLELADLDHQAGGQKGWKIESISAIPVEKREWDTHPHRLSENIYLTKRL